MAELQEQNVNTFPENPLEEVSPIKEAIDEVERLPLTSQRINEDDAALDLTVLKSALEGTDNLNGLYQEARQELSQTVDKNSLMKSYKQLYADEQKRIAINASVERAAQGLISKQDASELIDASQEMDKEYQGIQGQERIFAETLAPLDLDQFTVESSIAENHAWSTFQQWAESIGKWDTFKNYLGAFFVPDAMKDASDLVDGKFFSAKKDILNLVAQYQATDPRLRPELFNEIFEKAKIAYEGNHVKIAGLISLLHSYTPNEDFTLSQISDALDIIFSGTLATAGKVAKDVIQGTNIVRKAKKLKASKEAAILDGAPKSTGDKTTSAVNASPFKMEDFIPTYDTTDNISKEILLLRESIGKTIKEQIIDPSNRLKDEEFLVRIDAIDDVEKQRVIDDVIIKKQALAEERDVIFEEIEPVSIDKDGFTLKYKWDDGVVTETRKWKEDDAGTFIEINEDFKKNGLLKTALTKILTPSTILENVSKKLVNQITQGGLQSSRLRNELIAIQRSLNKGMSKDEVIAVNELLIAGDEAQKVFPLDQLLDGTIQLKSGQRKYTVKEIENYYKKVAFADEMWGFRNTAIKQELEFMGAKEIDFLLETDAFNRKMIGVVGDDFRSLPTDLPAVEKILTPQLNEAGVSRFSDLDIDKLAKDGYKPVRLVTPYRDSEGKAVRWAIVKNEGKEGRVSINSLPSQVLNKIPGYVPRIYKPGYTFVKDIKTGETIRAFERHNDAKRWINNQLEEDGTVKLEPFRDRDFNSFEALVEDANFYGGLYTGARKSLTPLVLNEKGEKLSRLSYGDAMNRYIENISEIMPLNEYRMALKQRFINTVNALSNKEGKQFGAVDWKTETLPITDAAIRKQLEFTRDYMLNQFKVWSPKERAWNNYMLDIAEISEGRFFGFGDKVAQGFVNLAHKDPLKAMRGATFHAHLGWFNIRQLYVQAQNAALAISMNPVYGLKAAADMVGMRSLMFMSDEALDTIKATNKWGLGRLVDDVKQFNRAGLKDSILRNADFDAAAEGIAPGTSTNFRRAAKAGLVMYENGELTSRLIAWGVAKRKLGLEGKILTDSQIKDVSDELFRIHMNLQRENAAWWQQNALAIPTQFMQVQAKFIENIVQGLVGKGQWTRKEATNVLIGQIVLYGTLGVPLVEEISEWMMDETGLTPEELQEKYPKLAEFHADGANGLLFQLLGFDNQFGGDTASLLAGLDDNAAWGTVQAFSQMFSGRHSNDTVGDIVFGPTANTINRSSDAIINLADTMRALWKMPTMDQAGKSMINSLDDFLSVASTWSNARKARELHRLHEVFSKNGNVAIGEQNLKDLNMMTIIAKGIGFPLDVEASYYGLKGSNRDRAQDLADKKNAIKKAMVNALKTGNIDRYQGLKMWYLEGLSPIEQTVIIEDLLKDLSNDQLVSDLDKEHRKLLTEIVRSGGRIPGQIETMNIKDIKESDK